jgi:deoxyribodipyrimidine photo-lyase
MKTPLRVIWFKRDLRIQDHIDLCEACLAGVVLPIYVWDHNRAASNDYSLQHQAFIQECFVSLRASLNQLGLTLFELHTRII